MEGEDAVVAENVLYGNFIGISVHDATGAVLEGNRVSNNLGANSTGILLDNATSAEVRGNLVYANGHHGIEATGTTGALIESNTVYANGDDGVHVRQFSTATVRNNVVTDHPSDGIYQSATSTVTSTGNDAFGNLAADWSGLSAGVLDISLDPAYVDVDGADDLLGGANGADDSFHLDPMGPAVDAGTLASSAVQLASGRVLADRSTRVDGLLDGGTLDQGFHYPATHGAPPARDAGDVRIALGVSGERRLALRTFDASDSLLTSALFTPPTSETVRWVRGVLSPLANSEELVAVLGETGAQAELELLRWTGDTWLADWTASGIVAADAGRAGFDLAYEAASGQALVVYSDGGATPVYRTLENGAWSDEASLPLNDGGGPDPDTNAGTVQWVELTSRPGSDEVALAFADDADDLVALVWDGTQWLTATATTLETALTTNAGTGELENRAFDAAYEASTGDLVIAWGRSGANGFHWSSKAAGSTAWSVAAQVLALSADTASQVDLASDPASHRIAAVAVDVRGGIERVGAATWDGSGWVDAGELDSQIRDANDAAVGDTPGAVAWLADGTAVCVYTDDSSGRLDWASWSSSLGWELRTDFAVAGLGQAESVQLERAAGGASVLALLADDAGAVFALRYDGSDWVVANGGAALTSSAASTGSRPFSLCVER